MPRTPNKFIDPAGVKTTYNWIINHSEEDASGKTRNIETGANTGQVGLIRQQGADSGSVLHISGVIFHEAQVREFWEWWELSRSQTIFFEDFAGDKVEVMLTKFEPIRHRTIRNPRDFANAPLHFWRYTMEMEVLRYIDGVMADAGVMP